LILLVEHNNLKKERISQYIMKECFKCGIEEDKSFLYEGISKEGIISVCRKCFNKSDIPLVEKKTLPKDFDPGRRESVRERLIQMAGLKEDKFEREREMRKLVEKKSETTLNDLVEKNFKESLPDKAESYEEVIDNFHWILMRKRRAIKITQEQLAKELYEPVLAIESAEKGILPKDYLGLIKKFEHYFDIVLLKSRERYFDPSNLANESKVSTGVTIGDLRERTPKKEEFIEKNGEFDSEEVKPEEIDIKKIEEVVGKPVEKYVEEKDSQDVEGVSQEELDKIIFGGKS